MDPDSLPSIEVLLVPPKQPFPQIRSEILELRTAREEYQKELENQMILSYTTELEKLRQRIREAVLPQVQELYQQKGLSPLCSLLEVNNTAMTVESVAISIGKSGIVDVKLKDAIKMIDEKRSTEQKTQVQKGIEELKQISSLIMRTVQKAMTKYFKSKKASFLQLPKQVSNIHQVLNVRVGSSSIGDGLGDGASYPSIVGMIEEENEDRSSAELVLLNTLIFYTDKLLKGALLTLESLLRVPAALMGNPSSFMQGGPHAAFSRILRKRALQHATVELNIEPPEMDDWTAIDQINAVLQAEMVLKKGRIDAYVRARRRTVKLGLLDIDRAIRKAAVRWKVIVDPSSVNPH